MAEFYIGPRYNLDGSPIDVPAGTLIPRPFDIRHNNRPVIGRSNGGTFLRGNFASFDLVYETTGDGLALALRARYNPASPFVWIKILDHVLNFDRWYQATMLEPHIERMSGLAVAGMVLPFRRVIPYEEP